MRLGASAATIGRARVLLDIAAKCATNLLVDTYIVCIRFRSISPEASSSRHEQGVEPSSLLIFLIGQAMCTTSERLNINLPTSPGTRPLLYPWRYFALLFLGF